MAHTGLERRINSISKAAGGGKVTIELPRQDDPLFFARVFPTTEQARKAVVDAASGSYTLDQLTLEIQRRCMTQIEYGRGPTLEEAVADLAQKLKAAPALESETPA